MAGKDFPPTTLGKFPNTRVAQILQKPHGVESTANFHPYGNHGQFAPRLHAHLRWFKRIQFQYAAAMHVQIVLLSAYLTIVIGKDEVRRNQFAKRRTIRRKHGDPQAFFDKRYVMDEVSHKILSMDQNRFAIISMMGNITAAKAQRARILAAKKSIARQPQGNCKA